MAYLNAWAFNSPREAIVLKNSSAADSNLVGAPNTLPAVPLIASWLTSILLAASEDNQVFNVCKNALEASNMEPEYHLSIAAHSPLAISEEIFQATSLRIGR